MTQSEVFRQLIAVFDDWRGFLKDPRYIRREKEITWDQAEILVLPEALTKEDAAELSRRGQYTFRVVQDDSVIQMSYRFLQSGEIDKARLAFYEVGLASDEQEMDVRPWADNLGSSSLAKWVRFDYSKTDTCRLLHMDSHLHISGLPGIRFAVTGIPTPRQFVEFVVLHFYQTDYQQHRLDEDQRYRHPAMIDGINSSCIALQTEVAQSYLQIPHFRIPNGRQ